MKQLLSFSAAVLGLGMALASAQAAADSTADVSISQVGYRLIDLDPNDGITPGITFVDAGNFTHSTVQLTGANFNLSDQHDTAVLDANHLAVGLPGGAATAAVAFTGGPLGSFTASGSMSTPGEYSTHEGFFSHFVLTPHTQLVWSGQFSGNAGTSGAAPSNDHYASSWAYSSIFDNFGYYDTRAVFVDTRSGQNHADYGYTFNFVNQRDEAVDGTITGSVSTSGQNAAPVPEPETWAMLLGGLALLGALARHRAGKRLA